jgi:hypothetical protein
VYLACDQIENPFAVGLCCIPVVTVEVAESTSVRKSVNLGERHRANRSGISMRLFHKDQWA